MAGGGGGTVKPVGEERELERERPVGYVGGFCTRGLDVEEDALLLEGRTGLAGTGYRGAVGVGCCLRVIPVAVGNTFRFAFIGYPKGLAVDNGLSNPLSSTSFSVPFTPIPFSVTRSPISLSFPFSPSRNVVYPKFISADFARPESKASLHSERSKEALFWWSRVK